MNFKNTPKPWQLAVLIAASCAGLFLVGFLASGLWDLIDGGFISFAVVTLFVAALVTAFVFLDRSLRRKESLSPVYLDVFKGCWGLALACYLVFSVDYTISQIRYLRDFHARQAKVEKEVEIPFPDTDSLLIPEVNICNEYYTGPYSHEPRWGFYDLSTREYDEWIDISDWWQEAYEEVEGSRHFCVIAPEDSLALAWTSSRLKRFADWATGKDIPCCPIINSLDQMCSYYYAATGGNRFEYIDDCDDIIEQHAIFLGSVMNTERYLTMEEYTWFDAASNGDTTQQSWFTIDRATGKELTFGDIVDSRRREEFNQLLIAHLCNWTGYWKDNEDASPVERAEYVCENFNGIALVPEGVVVYYHPYSIGCGAEGQYNSLIPYAELEGMLKVKID